MQYHKSFSDDEDDIDKLFSQLQTIEPPPSLVARVLAQVPVQSSSRLLFPQPMVLNSLDSWVMRDRRRKLC